MWCPPALIENHQGICKMKMTCCLGSELVQDLATTHPTASWTGLSYCKVGWLACGYTMKYKSTSGTNLWSH